MEVNESNEDIRKRSTILRQKLDLMNISINYAWNTFAKESWRKKRDIVEKELKEIDDALCRTEIVTKFDLMEFD